MGSKSIFFEKTVHGVILAGTLGFFVWAGCSDTQTTAPRAQTAGEQKKSTKKGSKQEDDACAQLDGSYHERVDHCGDDDDVESSTNSGSKTSTSTGTSTAQNTSKGTGTTTASSTATSTGTASSTGSSTSSSTGTGTGVALNVVTFQIAAGTGNRDWNTAATAVSAKVGQTLRITNMDTAPHRLHTGGVPCPHQPGTMNPGQSYDCVLTQAIDTTLGGASATYDHLRAAGETRSFFIKVSN